MVGESSLGPWLPAFWMAFSMGGASQWVVHSVGESSDRELVSPTAPKTTLGTPFWVYICLQLVLHSVGEILPSLIRLGTIVSYGSKNHPRHPFLGVAGAGVEPRRLSGAS